MIFHLARLVEWRHPRLTAPARPGGEVEADFIRATCPTCELGYLADPDAAADATAPADLAVAAQGQLAAECPDHPARFLVAAWGP
jgi:hypothetical protein